MRASYDLEYIPIDRSKINGDRHRGNGLLALQAGRVAQGGVQPAKEREERHQIPVKRAANDASCATQGATRSAR